MKLEALDHKEAIVMIKGSENMRWVQGYFAMIHNRIEERLRGIKHEMVG